VCEIPGVGPVPSTTARRALAHGLLELVIADGVDVKTVVSRTRHVPAALRIAIEHRSQGCCEIDGCDRMLGIERHHIAAFGEHRLTAYEVLVDVCDEHHDLVHHRGYTIWRGADGTFTLEPPRRDTSAA
jgi:5-methylcytosine-specific restriction protein A